MVKAGLGGCMGGDNLWIEMVCLPLPALHPLDSERPFFSTATKGEGSDCAGTFTGPLCFQMVLFSCDTVDTQHLPRIRTLLWGSTEGRWVVCRREGRGGVEAAEGRHEGTREEEHFGGSEFVSWESGFSYSIILSLPPHEASRSSSVFTVVFRVFHLPPPPPALSPSPHPVPYCYLPCPLLRHSLCSLYPEARRTV